MKAYHFLRDDMTAGSGNEPPWQLGEEREIKGEIRLCERGYHSSPTWFDALSYAHGNMACIVEVSKPISKDEDIQVSRKRKLIAAKNAEKTLRAWACDCAERALKKAGIKDERSWNAITVTRLYNEGKASKEDLDAAYAAAKAAADAASGDASDAAAYAARAAVGDAAYAAARDAADAASGDASWDAEIKWQKRRLNWYMRRLFRANTPVI